MQRLGKQAKADTATSQYYVKKNSTHRNPDRKASSTGISHTVTYRHKIKTKIEKIE
jgi:hypothetical protein